MCGLMEQTLQCKSCIFSSGPLRTQQRRSAQALWRNQKQRALYAFLLQATSTSQEADLPKLLNAKAAFFPLDFVDAEVGVAQQG